MSAHRSMSHGPAADRVSSRHRRCGTARDFAGRRAVSSAGSTAVMADETDAHLEPGDDAAAAVAHGAPDPTLLDEAQPDSEAAPTQTTEADGTTDADVIAEAER